MTTISDSAVVLLDQARTALSDVENEVGENVADRSGLADLQAVLQAVTAGDDDPSA